MIKRFLVLTFSLLLLNTLQLPNTYNIAMFKDDKNEDSNEDSSSSENEQS
ncbi:hypothetical protein OA264_03415 [Alphaproteobacteria bacterium]|nr:hypothetical protein [Alphaproteobacteria bacterium]